MSSQSSGSSVNTGQSTSTSKSTPQVMQSPQSQFLLALSGQLQGYADKTYAQYDQTFLPMQKSLMTRANQELSPAYQQQKGGQAIAGAAQLATSNRNTALQNLTAFGVGDPSNVGRRYSIDANMLNSAGATEAGAANEAMLAAKNEGRTDQNQAITNEQQAKAMGVAQSNAAMSLKLPPVANSTVSNSQSTNQGSSSNSSSSHQSTPSSSNSGNSNPSDPRPNGGGTTWPGMGSGGGGGTLSGNGGGGGDSGSGGNSSYDPFTGGVTDQFGGSSNPYMGAVYTDPNSYNNTGGSDYNPGATDTGGVYDPNASYNSYDSGGGGGDNSGYTGWAQGGAIPAERRPPRYAYDGGGAIDLQDGGIAPAEASPSGGNATDDIDAKVTAHEFVVPQDVALFKGQEFFYKLMDKSRQTRLEYQSGKTQEKG